MRRRGGQWQDLGGPIGLIYLVSSTATGAVVYPSGNWPMSRTLIERVADAVLYEGYVLYPYRPSVKNRQRWTFGGLHPEGGPDASACQAECLVAAEPDGVVSATVRFLHLTARQVGAVDPPLPHWPEGAEPAFSPVESLRVGDAVFHTWQEAEERSVVLADVTLDEIQHHPVRRTFRLPGRCWLEPIAGPREIVGVLAREQQALEGEAELSAAAVDAGLYRLTLRVANRTPAGGDALMRSLASTHALLGVRGGAFVSLLDPPDAWRGHAAACRNVGVWPVLVGEPGRTDAMLASPIILYDYPQLAPESPGDLFDGTEIDEILTLRILTLTDEEKRQMAATDGRVRELLDRTQGLSPDQLRGLHGTFREEGTL